MRLMFAAASAAVIASASGAVFAAEPIEGTWKLDVRSAHLSTKPEVLLLQNGYFECKSCSPPYRVKADGAPQPVSGSPYRDHVAVKVLGPRSIEQSFYKGGRKVGGGVGTVSPDGATLTVKFTDSSASNSPVTGVTTQTRVAPGPAGSAAISGGWREAKADVSNNGLMITYKVKDGALSMSSPTGQSYTARLDGAEAPYKGDPGTTSVSVKKTGPRTYVETDKRDGKTISVGTMTVSPDGKSATFAGDDKLDGTTTSYTAIRQ